MILKSIRLNNIRSYVNGYIEFPIGSTLLAGDIGSGKSSILAGIEFALFGLKKGELSPDLLLRHGKYEGSVVLNLEVDGKNVWINRRLKRGKNDIKQEQGYIIINNSKKEATADELKASVLELLGYPKEFLRKKELIYRYTVYTPQEEMKRIFYESKDARLDILRKVFNIDKYKRIIENTKILTTSLRERKRRLEGYTQDLDAKKEESDKLKVEVSSIQERITSLSPKIELLKSKLAGKKDSISEYEERIRELNELKKDFHVLDSKINYSLSQSNLFSNNIKKLDVQIEILKNELKEYKDADINQITVTINAKIKAKENELLTIESEYKKILREMHTLDSEKSHVNKTIDKILSLDVCPVCEQKVSLDHKHLVKNRETEKLKEAENKLNGIYAGEKELDGKIKDLKEELEKLKKEESNFNIVKLRKNSMDEKMKESSALKEDKKKLGQEIEKLKAAKSKIHLSIEKLKFIEELYSKARLELEQLQKEERILELERAGLEKESGSIKKSLASLQNEIKEKEKSVKELKRISEFHYWIDEFFVKLVSTMEKHVMFRLHTQFNDLFRDWFNIIIEDEAINVRLDDDFTPIIEQNGYETSMENLSGGEKTSAALSYRLALNKVINDIVSDIKTRDIIILDEPTDGFSTEQLDRVRVVLDQLNMKQVIVVSHESKIESYVDNIIRIKKEEHVSSIA